MVKLGEFNKDSSQVKQLKRELENLELALNEEKMKLTEYTKKKRETDEMQSKMNSAKMNLEQTSYHQKLEKITLLKEEIEKRKNEIEKLNEELVLEKEKHTQLNGKVNNQGKSKEEEKKDAQNIIKERKAFIENHQRLFNQEQQVCSTFNLEYLKKRRNNIPFLKL